MVNSFVRDSPISRFWFASRTAAIVDMTITAADRRATRRTSETMPFDLEVRRLPDQSATTRVSNPNGIVSLVRRVALISAAVIVISTIAVVREANQSREIGESFANEFAIADTAIQNEFSQ
ncbi:MAG: hypothetical protein DME89_00010 [Verrucomicrobia bacterium]|nr:MAG: hypothetical protein DME89_00010 [Verrucomicrobiota bacterium]